MHLSPPCARPLAALFLALVVSGCSDSDPAAPEPTMPDFEGTYSLLGTYTGRSGNRVDGTLVISSQSGAAATAEISVRINDAGNTSFALNYPDPAGQLAVGPVTATLANDGSFSATYSGRETIDGLDPASCCNTTFSLTGKLEGDRLAGTWSLTRDMPSSDTGTFAGTR